ncbi:MAG: DUF1127 domain-containing protein [Pseudomonadota bacterium]
MALHDSAHVYHSEPNSGRSILHRLAASFVYWNESRKTRAALSRLSDRELADIGIERGDIDTF